MTPKNEKRQATTDETLRQIRSDERSTDNEMRPLSPEETDEIGGGLEEISTIIASW